MVREWVDWMAGIVGLALLGWLCAGLRLCLFYIYAQ